MESKMQNKSCSNARPRRTTIRKMKKNKTTSCQDCGFRSNRAFNVIRHHERIHGPAKKLLECCGKKYPTKGEFYQHFVDEHPESKRASLVLSTLYKIRETVKKEEPVRRRSLRNIKSKESKNNTKIDKEGNDRSRYLYFDEDAPLINYVKNYKLVKKEEKPMKFEVFHDCHNLETTSIQLILFKGDATSPLRAKIQQEFLRNINFEDFKIV